MDIPGTLNIARWGNPIIMATEDHKVKSEPALTIYPNPSDDRINFSVDGLNDEVCILSLTDTNGNLLLRKPTRERLLDISWLPAGVYFLDVQHQRTSYLEKFIKR
jgi:hypothetical protein